MRGAGLKIGRIIGIPIYLHTSWFLIFAYFTYQFAGEFGALNPKWLPGQIWSLGLLTSLLFFGSVLFHELSHSVVARHYRIPVASITLLFFGGVARITREPESASQEFQIAGAGPASSYFLAGCFWLLARLTPEISAPHAIGASLSLINFELATFNLLPGFPLDGGRIFRSIIWGITKNYARSTRIASIGGQVVAYAMMAMGALLVFLAYSSNGDFTGGLLLGLIGWFVLTSARQSYTQVAAHGALETLRAADIMTSEMPAIGRDISLEEYAREVTNSKRGVHAVLSDGQLVGLMNAGILQGVPREEWPMTSVQAVMLSRDRLQLAAPEEPALTLLDRMRHANVDQMAVVSDGNVVGLVTRDSILRAVQTTMDAGRSSPGR